MNTSQSSAGSSARARWHVEHDAAHDALIAPLEDDTTLRAAAPLLELAENYLLETRNAQGAVSSPRNAQEIYDAIGESMPRQGRPLSEVAERLSRLMLGDVNRLAHPMYMGHQVSAPLPAAVWVDSLISAINNSVAVREMSPAFTPLERRIVRWMTDLVGWDERAGGTLTSGGTEATFAALLAARSASIPDVWTNGVGANPPVLICGEHAHYAVARAGGQMGLGLSRVTTVPSRDYRMDTDALRARLQALRADGIAVMAVVATAGSTATGSFDDLDTIADLCEEFGDIWLHVDAAHGGAAMIAPAHMHRIRGVARARSLAWDPHKTLLLPLAAGMVLVRDERYLESAFAQKAPYLFAPGNEARAWDTGTRTFMCSRRADVVKLWVALERYGADRLAALYEHLCDVTRVLFEILQAHDHFDVLHEPESNILCFAFTPPGVDPQMLDAETDRLRESYNRSGEGWITATTLNGRRVLRVTVMNARTTTAHVQRMVDGLLRQWEMLQSR